MARQLNTGNAVANNNTNSQRWKASAYLNLYVTQKNGQRSKIGAIALYANRNNDARLMNWLNQDLEANAKKLLNNMEMTYVVVEEDSGEFDL